MKQTIIQSIGYLTLFYANDDTSRIYYTDSRLGLNHGPFRYANEAVEHWTNLTHPMIKEYTTSKPAVDVNNLAETLGKPLKFTEDSGDNVIHVDFVNKVRIK